MEKMLLSQREFFNTNETKQISFRVDQLQKLKQALKESEELLLEAIYIDFKKSPHETYTSEFALVYHDINEAVKKIKRWSKPKRVKTDLLNFPARSYIVPEPLGNVLIIGAWNLPYLTSLAPLVAAIAGGNTVVIKPSEIAKNTSAAMQKVLSAAFKDNYIHVVEGGIPETTELLNHKFDKIFFTGSTPVGKIVYQAASKKLIPVTLELGGKSPVFITKSCNLKRTVQRLIWAKFLNAGQACTAPDFFMVDKVIKQQFLELAKQEIIKANYSVENDNYVQIVDRKNYDRVMALIDPGKVYFGGKTNEKDRIIEPTILDNVSFDDAIMQEEIFGPILPVIEYDNIDEILGKVKALPKPLACYIYTESGEEKRKMLNELSFGGGAINESHMHVANSNLPFGGIGNSGMGSYHGEFGFKTFSHFKGIIDKPTWFELRLKYAPYSATKLKWIKTLFRLS